MPSYKHITAFAASSAVAFVAAQSSSTTSSSSAAFTPLAAKRFDWDDLPYQADTDNAVRGRQVGYNRCNATTEGQDSLCQTAVINGLDDFCLWSPPEPNSVVGDTEGEMVAWCTRPGRGTRLIPEGALKGVQFLRAETYVQVTGRIDQTFINIMSGDYGGEMDPHGADRRGNPLGGLLYSTSFNGTNGTNGTTTSSGVVNGTVYSQVLQWHNFMGSNIFCLKACDPDDANGYRMCEHIFDRIGCYYNAPADYEEGVFEDCESDDQMYPGYYVEDGQTRTYTQPPESLGVISTMPYQPMTPATSQCTPYVSSEIYAALATVLPDAANSLTQTPSGAAPAATSTASSSVVTNASNLPASVSARPSTTAGVVNNAARPTASSTSSAAKAVAGVSGLAAALLGACVLLV